MTEPDPNWNGDRCTRCPYVISMGNRRTSVSRSNWRRYCMVRHDQKHAYEAGIMCKVCGWALGDGRPLPDGLCPEHRRAP